jgi:hypothetical protein
MHQVLTYKNSLISLIGRAAETAAGWMVVRAWQTTARLVWDPVAR